MRHVLVIVLALLVCYIQCVDLAYRKNTIQAYYINVKDAPYNATGDGIKDDTSAFQNALNAVGNAGGGVVFAPTGNYLIAGVLQIPTATALQGVSSHVHKTYGDPSKKTVAGTTLLAYFGVGNTSATPFITLVGHDSGIEGLQIFYPKQTITNPPVPYPYTIQCGNAQFPEIENIRQKCSHGESILWNRSWYLSMSSPLDRECLWSTSSHRYHGRSMLRHWKNYSYPLLAFLVARHSHC
jgi:hypothetical protein